MHVYNFSIWSIYHFSWQVSDESNNQFHFCVVARREESFFVQDALVPNANQAKCFILSLRKGFWIEGGRINSLLKTTLMVETAHQNEVVWDHLVKSVAWQRGCLKFWLVKRLPIDQSKHTKLACQRRKNMVPNLAPIPLMWVLIIHRATGRFLFPDWTDIRAEQVLVCNNGTFYKYVPRCYLTIATNHHPILAQQSICTPFFSKKYCGITFLIIFFIIWLCTCSH